MPLYASRSTHKFEDHPLSAYSTTVGNTTSL